MNNEVVLRKIIRKKIGKILTEKKKNEHALRIAIRKILKEGDLSDTHPHRSTGINTLEDVLKKSLPTLRTDYKRLTTDKSQRDSFRAHIIKAVKNAIAPETFNSAYGVQAGGGGLLAEPSEEEPVFILMDPVMASRESPVPTTIEPVIPSIPPGPGGAEAPEEIVHFLRPGSGEDLPEDPACLRTLG